MQAQGANQLPAQHLARPGAKPSFMVPNAIFICGIVIPTLFQVESQAEQIVGKVFDDYFLSYMDKTIK